MGLSNINNKPYKALFLLNRLDIGGTSINTIPLIDLLGQEFDVKVLYGKRDSDYKTVEYFQKKYPSLIFTPVKNLKKNGSLLYLIRAYLELSKQIRSFRPQIVHTHGSISGIIGRLSGKANKVPIIIHTYHGHLFHSYFTQFKTYIIIFLERILAKITDGIIVLSNQQQEDVLNKYKITVATKIFIIPLGIQQQYFEGFASEKRSFFRKKFDVEKDTIAIGLVGRLVPIKNPLFFIKICLGLQKLTGLKLVFFIVGDGELNKALQQYLNKFQIPYSSIGIKHTNPLFIFTSWYTDIAEVYHGLDILALTSLNEGTPLSMIEAQFCGKPVVSTNIGGVKDAVVNGVTGFLVDNLDGKAFADKLLLLINSADLRKTMGTNAHYFIKGSSLSEKQYQQTLELYKTLITQKIESK